MSNTYNTLQKIANEFNIPGYRAEHEIADESVYVYRESDRTGRNNEVATLAYYNGGYHITGKTELFI